MRAIGFIFARGGSKGIPRKNLQALGAKPLIAHAIHCGLAVPGIERVVVSTDDAEIADAARSFGAEVPFLRPAELAGDASPEFLAWKHAIGEMTARTGPFDLTVSLPTTSPLRLPEDVRRCMAEIESHPGTDVVITVQKSARSPYFNMVSKDAEGLCSLVAQRPGIARRQDVPEVFDITTVAYVARTQFVMSSNSLFEGRVRSVEVPRERAVDIDEPLDLEWARFLYAKQNPPTTA